MKSVNKYVCMYVCERCFFCAYRQFELLGNVRKRPHPFFVLVMMRPCTVP
jgi:hypothetical protein